MSERDGKALERLLAQEGWLRRLARALVTDASLAEDVAQETWARVLAQSPRRVASPRAWLGSIARRVVGERVEDERSRKGRERRVAAERPEAVDETAFADRVEAAARVQQRLARALLELTEPSRSTLVLRYFEGRSAAQIARETGVPESTVRNRVRRALAELRDVLDREAGGDRSRWLPGLLPLAGLPPASIPFVPLAAAEVLLMGVKTKLLLAGALVALACVPLVLRDRDASPLATAVPGSIAEQGEDDDPGLAALDQASARAPASETAAEPEQAQASAVDAPAPEAQLPAGSLEVLVVRPAAAGEADIPVSGGRVWLGLPEVVFLPRDLEAESDRVRFAALDATGTARFHGVPPGRLPIGVQVGHGGLVQTHVGVPSNEGARCVVRLGDSGLRGTVRDPSGPIVAGARLQISPLRVSAEGVRHASSSEDGRVHAVTWTDGDGRYEALHLPSGAYGVGVDLSGWQDTAGGEYAITLELPASVVREHDFGRPKGLPIWRGRVRTKAGEPAVQPANAVGHGGRIHLTRADRWGYSHHRWEPDGSFAIRLEPGTYDVAVSLPGRDERFTVLEGLDVNSRLQDLPLELDLHVPGTTLTGFAAQGQWVSLRPAPGERPHVWIPRPADGLYRFDGIAPGRWWLTAGELTVECTVLETDAVLTVDLR